MKKITLISLLLMFSLGLTAQNINNTAVWGPGTTWTVTGSSAGETDPLIFEADPTVVTNFAWDDDEAGTGVANDIAAESPVIDLTPAGTETWLRVTADVRHNWIGDDTLFVQYWDADLGAWVTWQSFIADTADTPFDNFCTSVPDTFVSMQLNIAGWTPTQLSGFRYRLLFDDALLGDNWGWGMCFDQPTLTSETPPTCPDPIGLAVTNVLDVSADFAWTETGTAAMWDIELVDITGGGTPGVNTGVPTTNDHGATSFGFTGLTPSNDYEAWVRADCGSSQSNWVGPVAFTSAAIPPANDECDNAISLIPGVVYADNQIDASSEGATDSGFTNSCGGSAANDIWFSLVVPGDGNITIETGPDELTGDTGYDSAMEAYTSDSDCTGTLTSVGCDDDGAAANLFSLLDLTGLTPGSTLYIRVWEFGGDQFEPFSISAYNPSLSISEFELNNFKYFPNPVNDNLSLSAQSNIQYVEVFNLLGQEVMRMTPNTLEADVNMDALSQGSYFVKVTINDVTKTIKIIKK